MSLAERAHDRNFLTKIILKSYKINWPYRIQRIFLYANLKSETFREQIFYPILTL